MNKFLLEKYKTHYSCLFNVLELFVICYFEISYFKMIIQNGANKKFLKWRIEEEQQFYSDL